MGFDRCMYRVTEANPVGAFGPCYREGELLGMFLVLFDAVCCDCCELSAGSHVLCAVCIQFVS